MWFRTLLNSLKLRPSGDGVRSARNRLSSRLRFESLEDRVVPALHTWTGGGEDNLWSNPDNWDGGVPKSDEPTDTAVEFLGNTSSVMDIAGLEVDLIVLADENNTITLRNTITLNPSSGAVGEAPIQVYGGALASSTHTITGAQLIAPVVLRVTVDDPAVTLIIESPISGTNGLRYEGVGTLSLRGTQSYSGTTTVLAGTLEVAAGGSLLNSPVVLDSDVFGNGTILGGGTVAQIDVREGVRVAPGGGVSTQTLTVTNSFGGRLTYQPTIIGANSDGLNVNGMLDLRGMTLSVLPIQAPTAATYTLIHNDGTDGIVGTFAGLPEGATVLVAGLAYTISYVGGTGNDVLLTRAGEPTVPPTAPSGPPSGPLSTPPSQPAFSGAQVIGRFLVLTGASVPNGVQLVPVPLGSVSLFADVTSDGRGDVLLFIPNMTLVIDGRTGRLMGLDTDDNGDGARDLQIFNPDGSATRVDGRTGLVLVF